MKKLTEKQIHIFVRCALEVYGIKFDPSEIEASNKGEDSSPEWKLLFTLFMNGTM